jgi:hypothetical protein
MQMQLKIKLLFIFVFGIVLFSGCIPVDDISPVWDKATLNPDIEGHWKQVGVKYRSQDKYISFVKKGDEYEVEMTSPGRSHLLDDSTPNSKARCLTVNGWGVLVIDMSGIKKKFAELEGKEYTKSQSGGLYLYKIKNGMLHLFSLKHKVLAKAISDKKIDGIVDEDDVAGPRIKKIDRKTIEYIITLASQDSNIQQVTKYQRIQDIKKALKKSNEYPTTDGTLKNTLIEVNFPELKYFAEGKIDILMNQLQASPEWEVKDKNGEIICSKRIYKRGQWRVGSNGYESSYDEGIYKGSGFYQIKSLFRFSKTPYGFHAVWAKENHVMKVEPEVGEINLKLKLNDQGVKSYIAVGQKNLWFEFYEQRKKEPRIHTQKALRWLKKFLADVKKAEKEIQQNGFAKKLLPKNSIKKGKSSIKIEESSDGKRFTINAWINPEKSGYVYLKLFDKVKDIQQSARLIKFVSNEFVGYSSNSSELFSYKCGISDYDDEWNHVDEGRFELWFHPKDGGAEVKLIETTKKRLRKRPE